jgi:hypothetical protein
MLYDNWQRKLLVTQIDHPRRLLNAQLYCKVGVIAEDTGSPAEVVFSDLPKSLTK